MFKKIAILALVLTMQVHSMDQREDLTKDIKANLKQLNDLLCSIPSEWYKLDSNNIIKEGHCFTPSELESLFNDTKKVIKKNVLLYGPLATIILTGTFYGVVSINKPQLPNVDDKIFYATVGAASMHTALISYLGYKMINDFKSAANKTLELYKKLRKQI